MLSYPCDPVTATSAAAAARLAPSPAASSRWRRVVHAIGALYRSDEAFTGGLLLGWGLAGMLAHLWLQALVSLV